MQVLAEAQECDLVVLGQRTHFEYGWRDQADETLARVLKDSPRPMVMVPTSPIIGEAVMVAYDGSLQAARALAAFESSGLGQGRKVHVVSVADSKKDAACWAERAVEFLRFQQIKAETWSMD